MTTKTITLEKPVSLFGAQISEVRIKEPTGLQYLQLGDPRMPVSMGDGGGYWIEQPKIIQDYLDRILDHGDGKTKDGGSLIALLSFADARAIKKALFDFFRPAAATLTE
jgi:hypothetical protein